VQCSKQRQCNNGNHANEKEEMLPKRNDEGRLLVQDPRKVQKPGTQTKNEETR
jgi:hypothetical protein